jgi:hypothetical protein
VQIFIFREDPDFEREQVATFMTDGKKRATRLEGIVPEDNFAKEEAECTLPTVYPSLGKVLSVISDEWYIIALGLIGCVISGAIIPILAVYLGQIFQVSSGQWLLFGDRPPFCYHTTNCLSESSYRL